MPNIILCGCGGRMGKVITELAAERDDVRIVAGVEINAAANPISYPVFSTIDELLETDIPSTADVIVDFSHHTVVSSILKFSLETSKPAVIATTGHTDEEIAAIKAASEKIPVFYTYNMSIGISLLEALVKKAASLLGGFDIEIVEKHHRMKLDSPSGTAIMLAKAAAEGAKERTGEDSEFVYGRHERRMTRPDAEIGISSVRGGTIVGEHEVIFAGPSELITISHSAQSRDIFAHGALRAAAFLPGKSAGLYTMQNIVDEAAAE